MKIKLSNYHEIKSKTFGDNWPQGCGLHKRSWIEIISSDLPPFLGVTDKGGDDIGEVLRNKEGMKECRKLIEKFIDSIKSSDSGTLHS